MNSDDYLGQAESTQAYYDVQYEAIVNSRYSEIKRAFTEYVSCEKDGETRPTCADSSHCCGAAFAKGDEENLEREQQEYCAKATASEINYTATWDIPVTTLGFQCIESATALMGTTLAFVSAMIATN